LPFDSRAYGTQVSEILALGQDGNRNIPLVADSCISGNARARLKKQKACELFAGAYAPEEALAGLWLYFSCSDECHQIVQDLESPEACFWHAILHRQEPDAANACYWFRRVGSHRVFADLWRSASELVKSDSHIAFRLGDRWDPFAFVAFCEAARKMPGSPTERAAMEIQTAEWQFLFDYCARFRP